MVYRRISGLSEVIRILESEGLLWVEPFKVSKQALSKRLACLPTELFGEIFELVMVKIQSQIDVVTYLVKNHKMLGLIKQQRKRHRENAAYYQEIWGSTA